MKKFAIVALTLASTTAFANELTNYDLPTPQTLVQYNFGAYNVNNGVVTPLQNNTISRGNPNHRLCWTVIAPVPMFTQTVSAKETITSPVGGSFTDGKSIVQSSIDGTHHVVSSMITPIGGTILERCWQFNTSDPLGKYTLSSEFNGEVMPMREFTVVE